MLHKIFSGSAPLNNPDKILARLTAKQTLSTHLLSILPQIRFATLTDAELIDQVIQDSIHHLHPVFSGPEIFNEIQMAAIAMLIPKPNNLEKLFTQTYHRIVTNKIKLNGKNLKGKTGNGQNSSGSNS